MVEGTPSVAERLMREVLYYVARARPVSERVREVQDAYHLNQTIPAADSDGPAESLALKSAREHLTLAKDAWNKFASGNPPSLLAFCDSASALKDSAGQLGNADLAALAGEIAGLAAWLTSNRERMSEAVALEVATALLLLENALAGVATLSGEFAQQAQLLCSRLKDCVLGKLRRTTPEMPLLDEMSRKAQERLLMSQVVSEMQANLRSVEQVLDAFFRDTAKRDELASLDKPIRQLLGALEMLGESRARDALAAAGEEIASFSAADYRASPRDFERVAQTLSGLGFYIEGLAHGKADFDAAMQPIAAAKEKEEETDLELPGATVEAQIAEQQRETESLYEEWKKKPKDKSLRAELQKNLAGAPSSGQNGHHAAHALPKASDRENHARGRPVAVSRGRQAHQRERRDHRRGASQRVPRRVRRGAGDDPRVLGRGARAARQQGGAHHDPPRGPHLEGQRTHGGPHAPGGSRLGRGADHESLAARRARRDARAVAADRLGPRVLFRQREAPQGGRGIER
jgi:hypothetical protein